MSEDNMTFPSWPRKIEEREGRILNSLRSFQIIELVLKTYIQRSAGTKPKPPNGLGKLIEVFGKLNGNTDLIAELSAIRNDRNLIAHEALIANQFVPQELFVHKPLTAKQLQEIDRRAMGIMTKLVCECIKSSKEEKIS